MSLHLGLGFGLGTAQGGGFTPLRAIGVNEQVSHAFDSVGGTNRAAVRQPLAIGQAAKSLVFSVSNWVMNSSTGETNNTNTFTILEAALEKADGSAYAKITFSGSDSVTLAIGDNNIQSDALSASAFGLGSFARDSEWFIRLVMSVPVAGNKIPYVGTIAADKTGGQAMWYDSAAQSRTAYGTGTYSTTGVTTRFQGYRPIVLGYPVTDGASFITVGDSISIGIGDSTANGAIGRGYIQHAMGGSTGTPVNSYPNLNFGVSGIGILPYTGGTKWKTYLQYAKIAIDQILTNNVSSLSTGQMQTEETSLWTIFRTSLIKKIIRTELLVRSSSTDSWATTVNQTVLSGWENGGKVTTMNNWWPTKVSDTTIDYYVSGLRALVADGTSTDKWAVPKLYNNDDVHPMNSGVLVLKAPMRTAITTVAGTV